MAALLIKCTDMTRKILLKGKKLWVYSHLSRSDESHWPLGQYGRAFLATDFVEKQV